LRASDRPRLRSLLALPLLLCALACQTAPAPAKESAAPAPPHEDSSLQLATAQDKLAIAKIQLELDQQRAESNRARKEVELELARRELDQFLECDSPSQLAKSQLELTRHRDALVEQQEELAQLEMLYEKQDLADKTREIVLQRGQRRVARAQEELAIAERDAKTLEERTLPRQHDRLKIEIETKTYELNELKPEAEAALLEKRMAVRAAEAELQAAQAKAGGSVAKP
jgi:hypothetical protein